MKKIHGKVLGGQSIRYNCPMGGAHESYDTKVSTKSEYTSNEKSVLKNTYPFGRSSDDRYTHTQTDRHTDMYLVNGRS